MLRICLFVMLMYTLYIQTSIVIGGTEAEMRALLVAKLNSSDYSPRVRPIKDTGNILSLVVDMYLVAINGVDEVEQKITTTAYMKIVWSDSFMTWTPTDYGNITQFTIPQDNIWKPDLALANAYDTITGLGDTFMYLTITNDGNITWEPFQVFDSTCNIDMTYFPFDSQSCDIQLVTWSSTREMINIVTGSDGFNIDAYEENANWYLSSVSTKDSSTASTSGLSFTINIKRKPIYYLLNFMIPIVLLSVLNNFVFVLPCDSGEKTGYAIVLFLSFAIFLLIVTEIMPEGMNTIPIVSSYLLVECIFSTIIVFITIVQLRLHNQGDDTPIPNYFQVLTKFIQGVKSKICCESNSEKDDDDNGEETPIKIPLEPIKRRLDSPVIVEKRNKKMEEVVQIKTTNDEKPSVSNQVKRKLCCGASNVDSDEHEMSEMLWKGGSSEVGTEVTTVSAKTAFRLSDLLGNENRVTPNAFFSKPTSVEPIYDHTLAVEDVDDIEEIIQKPPPKMANVQLGLRQTGFRPLKTPEPKDLASDTSSVKSSNTESSDEITWPEVVLALDNMFFVLFLIINTLATTVAFSVSALG
ncbi:acetylcholine receptor subunit alpha-like [Mercenaria mercenaria]|uniref:acetylcholine receptor subunit alpha-like n=1 Tax=Mercenaria mercenaria TaxID=6596 RepID=UPI00234F90FD|nr:acetylcholine receptor subunit alpha-like [Mercenaria mercenaria]